MDQRILTSAQKTLRLECQGLEVGDLVIPSFKLHAGEALCLHVEHARQPWYESLLPLFKGEVIHSGLSVHGVVRYLDRPMPARGWFGRRKDLSALDWLVVEKQLPLDSATEILDRAHVSAVVRIGWMGWNERTMLGLEYNLTNPPELLVFDSAGNDSLGIGRIFDRLASRPKTLALLYLKLVASPCSPCVPGGHCVEVTALRTEPALVE